MIDFNKSKVFKLTRDKGSHGAKLVDPLLVDGEEIIDSFSTIRDVVVFTNKRIIAVNVQGLTGLKKDFTTLPYRKIQAFSVESAGLVDMEGELDLWFSGGLGQIRFEFLFGVNLAEIGRVISENVL